MFLIRIAGKTGQQLTIFSYMPKKIFNVVFIEKVEKIIDFEV